MSTDKGNHSSAHHINPKITYIPRDNYTPYLHQYPYHTKNLYNRLQQNKKGISPNVDRLYTTPIQSTNFNRWKIVQKEIKTYSISSPPFLYLSFSVEEHLCLVPFLIPYPPTVKGRSILQTKAYGEITARGRSQWRRSNLSEKKKKKKKENDWQDGI